MKKAKFNILVGDHLYPKTKKINGYIHKLWGLYPIGINKAENSKYWITTELLTGKKMCTGDLTRQSAISLTKKRLRKYNKSNSIKDCIMTQSRLTGIANPEFFKKG